MLVAASGLIVARPMMVTETAEGEHASAALMLSDGCVFVEF